MIGLADHERVDAALYDDFESDKAREVINIYFYFSWWFLHVKLLHPYDTCVQLWTVFMHPWNL